ncbi:MAG TPA: hypothetical protein VMR25_11035 [Planctomycetaceae bacterium]|jgi:hypothetical protein|nr:hypothetical protein [Planctomycetaceae bacterium]
MDAKFNTEDEAEAYIRVQTYEGARKAKSLDVMTPMDRTLKTYRATFTDGTQFVWTITKAGDSFFVSRFPPREPFYMPED